MLYNFNGKSIRISDAEIEKNMRLLDISKDEAIQMWLEDNDYATNEVVEELTKKAKENKINHEARAEKRNKVTKRERKPDEEKQLIVAEIAKFLAEKEGFSVEIRNKEREISLIVGENDYSITLTKHRTKKK